MIPKILHFIWFGRHIPKYVQFSISAFQKVNSDFKIHFVYRDIKTVEEIIDDEEKCKNDDDILLRRCGLSILNQDELYINTINHCKKSKLKFIQILLDIYRLDVLNYYGGIYLDCDTFPVKKFDQQLMNNKSFIVTRHYNENIIVNDNYFMGCQKNIDSFDRVLWETYKNDSTSDIIKILQTQKGWNNDIKFLINKKKFFECKLRLGEYSFSKDFYIDHYSSQSWKDTGKGIMTPICKFDESGNR